jgi:hypothetical protein
LLALLGHSNVTFVNSHKSAAQHDEASNEYIRQLCSQQIAAEGGLNGASASGDSCWIGANDQATEGTQVWSDGTEIDYDDWKPGEPNNALYSFEGRSDISEDVTAFNLWCTPSDGPCCATRTCPAWNDNHENRQYTFICEEHPRPQGGGH